MASQSGSDDSLVTMAGDAANISSGEFLFWGNDDGATTGSTEIPAALWAERLAREWKVQETGDVGTVDITFDLTNITETINYSDTASFALLIDADGDLSDATATTGATISGSEVMFTGVDFSNGQYFGLAYPGAAVTCTNSSLVVDSVADVDDSDYSVGQNTLREAIACANAGDTITFDNNISGQTITLANQLEITKSLTINGSVPITVSGNNAVRIFEVSTGTDLALNSLTLINGRPSTIVNGGAILNRGTLTVTQSTFDGNMTTVAGAGGGAIFNLGTSSVATIQNSTFVNGESSNGGALYNLGTLTVDNSTFAGNKTTSAGADIHNQGTLHIRNTIMADKAASSVSVSCFNAGTIATNINNLIEDGSCSPAVTGDPNLAPLQDNSGNTQTMALLAGSPAIDAGDNASCLSVDQRGVSRPQGSACDIGAYEFDGAAAGSQKIYFVGSDGIVTEYPTLTDFANGTNASVVGNGAPNGEYGNDAGVFVFNDKIYLVRDTGDVMEFPTLTDFANFTNGTVIGTGAIFGAYGNDAGVFAFNNKIYQIENLLGSLVEYPSLSDFAAYTNWSIIGGNASYGNDAGAFVFNDKFYLVEDTGDVTEFPTLNDLANFTNKTVIGSGGYGDGAGVFAYESVTTMSDSLDAPITADISTVRLIETAVVTSTKDNGPGSLREMITLAKEGKTITFDKKLKNKTIKLDSQLVITKNLTLDGANRQLTISGDNKDRVFKIADKADVTLKKLTISDGRLTSKSKEVGAGILVEEGTTLTIEESIISDNHAHNSGGIHNDGTLIVERSAIIKNSAWRDGAGLQNGATGTAMLTNCTISTNVTINDKAGYANLVNSGRLTLLNCTIANNADNTRAVIGGIDNRLDGMLFLQNSIVSNPSSAGDCRNEGQIFINTSNLISDGSCEADFSGDAKLAPLAKNGFEIPSHALLPTSPAIDAGNDAICPDRDLRGNERPAGTACDIGAFESEFSVATPTPTATTTSTTTPTSTPTTTITPKLTGTANPTATRTASATKTTTTTPTTTPTKTATADSTDTPTVTTTTSTTVTRTPRVTATPTERSSATATATVRPTLTPTESPAPTRTQTTIPTRSATSTATPSATMTKTSQPTKTATTKPSHNQYSFGHGHYYLECNQHGHNRASRNIHCDYRGRAIN